MILPKASRTVVLPIASVVARSMTRPEESRFSTVWAKLDEWKRMENRKRLAIKARKLP